MTTKLPKGICECGQPAMRKGCCYDCFAEKRTWIPTPEEIKAAAIKIRRENGHDQQRPLLPGMARGA